MKELRRLAMKRRIRRIQMTRDELRTDFRMFSIMCAILILGLVHMTFFGTFDSVQRFLLVSVGLPIAIGLWTIRYIHVKKVLHVQGPRWQKPSIKNNDDGGERE